VALPNIPVSIFMLSESPSPQDHAAAWAAALILIIGVLMLSVSARYLYDRSRRKIQG
jgi:ABC-type phosphate transport system permease subunit